MIYPMLIVSLIAVSMLLLGVINALGAVLVIPYVGLSSAILLVLVASVLEAIAIVHCIHRR